MSLSTMYPSKNNSPKTTLTTAITSEDTALILADASVLPAAPNLLVLGTGDNAEIASYTTITGNVVSGLVRGVNGTTPGAWPVDTIVARNFTTYDADTFRENILDLENRKANSADLGTMSAVNDADSDTKAYGRKDGGWYDLDGRYYTESEMDTKLGDKAPLASPAFSGTPTTPTPADGDNSLKIASTAWVLKHLFYSSSSLGNNNAGFHNSIFRGKSLGSSVSSAQWSAISAGTFDDLFIGDYWTINSIVWRIAAFDYWYRCGDTECTTHHAVIVPDSNLLTADGSTTHWMHSSNTTEGGYVGTDFYAGTNSNTGKSQCRTKAQTAFGSSHILSHKEYLTNSCTSGTTNVGYPTAGAWYASDIEMMNEQMVYGCKVFGSRSAGSNIPADYTIDKGQLPLFALAPQYICNRAAWWLRDPVSSTSFAYVGGYGDCNYTYASTAWVGVRPAFGIC